MKTLMKNVKRLTLAAFTLAALSGAAHAVNPASLDITVSINATKSLSVGATFYDFGAQAVSVSTVSTSAIAVTNNSSGLIESYAITGTNAASTGGGTSWTIAASTGTDIYALAAQFSTAQPNNADSFWTSDNLSASVVNCDVTGGTLGNGTVGQSGYQVNPTASRNLWFRLKTPGIVTDTTQRKVTLTLAVQ